MVEISYEPFGVGADGPVTQWHLEGDGVGLTVLDRGATVHVLRVPDRDGVPADVAAGFGDLASYEACRTYFGGAVVGRYAGRIAHGRFALDGQEFQLDTNENDLTLHGGPEGFDRRIWSIHPDGDDGIRCTLVSEDGDQGFPGRLEAEVVYRLLPGAVRIEYRAVTDAPTVVNLTQHLYFALDGATAGTTGHVLQVPAEGYVPTTPDLIPTGTIEPVAGTAIDLREPRPVDDVVAGLVAAGVPRGIDHNLDLGGGGFRLGAVLTAPASGRRVEVFTDEPGMQVFSGTPLDGSLTGKDGVPLRSGAGICLEPQHFPDTPNRPEFPSARLDPGQEYRSTTEWRFSTVS